MKCMCLQWLSLFVLLPPLGCDLDNQPERRVGENFAREYESFDGEVTAQTASQIEVESIIQSLQETAGTRQWAERAQTIKTIGRLGDDAQAAVPVLRTVLDNPQEHSLVQSEAACALAELSPGALVDLTNRRRQVRLTAAFALGKTSSRAEEVRLALESALEDEYWEVRAEAARSLNFRGPEAVPALQRTLHDVDPRVRAAAAWSLGRLGRPAHSAAGDLRAALSDGDWLVRSAAIYALDRMGAESNADVAAATADAEWGVRSTAQSLQGENSQSN